MFYLNFHKFQIFKRFENYVNYYISNYNVFLPSEFLGNPVKLLLFFKYNKSYVMYKNSDKVNLLKSHISQNRAIKE